MSSQRDPTLWLVDILDCIQEIEDATNQVEAETFVNNRLMINAVSCALLEIGRIDVRKFLVLVVDWNGPKSHPARAMSRIVTGFYFP